MPVTWLHISDLHLRNDDSYDRVVVFRALVRSVKRFREREGRTANLIFATGDIAHSGKQDEYDLATEFFDQLLDASALTRRELFVLPGNHDVDRSIGRQLLRQLASREDAEAYFDPKAPWLHLRHKMGSFVSWHDAYFKGIRRLPTNSTCGPVELFTRSGTRLGLLPVNTAIFCQDDYDFERLCVGRRCIDDAISQLEALDADLKIALMHHPVEHLSTIERQHIRAALVDHLDMILTGHLHEAGFVCVDMPSVRNFRCAAGATYQTRNYPNTAYYATFDTDQVTIFPIRYEDQPREIWVVDPSLFSDTGSVELTVRVPCSPAYRGFRILGYDESNGMAGPQAKRVANKAAKEDAGTAKENNRGKSRKKTRRLP